MQGMRGEHLSNDRSDMYIDYVELGNVSSGIKKKTFDMNLNYALFNDLVEIIGMELDS